MSNEKDVATVLQGHNVARTLTLHMPEELIGTEKESIVRNICTMAIAGVAVETANTLLTNHGVEGVVMTTG